MLQAKAYARTNGAPYDKQEMDRSLVYHSGLYLWECHATASTRLSPLINPLNTWILIMCIFILSNILILTSTVLYFRKIFLWLQQKQQQMKILDRASAIVLTVVNMGALISDILFIIRDIPEDNLTVLGISPWFILPAKIPLVLLILILETPVACFNTHKLNQANNKRQYRIAHACICPLSDYLQACHRCYHCNCVFYHNPCSDTWSCHSPLFHNRKCHCICSRHNT